MAGGKGILNNSGIQINLNSTGRVQSKGINFKIKAKNETSLKALGGGGNSTTKKSSHKKPSKQIVSESEQINVVSSSLERDALNAPRGGHREDSSYGL